VAAPVFISHSSKDRAVAQTICTAIENCGIRCWISTRDIGPGENYQVKIVYAIRAARVMVLVFSANTNNSDEIKKEIALADRGKLVVIPLRVEDVQPDDALDYEFATRQWIDLFDNWEQAIGRVVEQIKMVVGDAPSGPAIPAARAQPEKSRAGSAGSDEPPAAVGDAGAAGDVERRHQPLRRGSFWLAIVAAGLIVLSAAAVGIVRLAGSGTASQSVSNVDAAEATQLGELANKRQDYPVALHWFRRGADLGNVTAEFYLAFFYSKGWGVAQDYAESAHWYRKAADAGNADAELNLGYLYDHGLGVPLDPKVALGWFRKAAAQGNSIAERNIGLFYEQGRAVPRDPQEARSWMEKAAAAGNSMAKTWLASHQR
jgi:TIR domain/Sel1 repeat